jgi:two-component system, LytTR family, response regulator
MRTVFVEDTASHRDTIRQMLMEHCPQVQIVGEADSIETGYALIKKENPELVLLDVELYPGTAFDLLKRLQAEGKIIFEVIFLTGFTKMEYLLRAIQYAALDFLMKPIDEHRLREAIERVERKLADRQDFSSLQEQITLLLDNLRHPPENRSNRIIFHRGRGVINSVHVDEIVYCESDGDVTKVFLHGYTQNEKNEDVASFKAMRSLASYAKLLEIDFNFFRISDRLLVNLNHLDTYNHRNDYELLLKNGRRLYASRRGGQELNQHLNRAASGASLNNAPEITPETENNILKMILKKLLGG